MNGRIGLALALPLAALAAGDEVRTVAVPPAYARREMCVTADGEIRHYGFALDAQGRKRRVYVASRDGGTNWTTRTADPKDVGAMVKSPWSDRWVALSDSGGKTPVTAWISEKGPGDAAAKAIVQKDGLSCEPRPPLALRSRRRWVSPASCVGGPNGYEARVFLSDDDGETWRLVVVPDTVPLPEKRDCDAMPLWRNPACEPSIAELSDGTLLMAVRCSEGHHWFYRSSDGGETWGKPERGDPFHATNTMPLLFRLRDGRLLFFWNNADPLPRLAPENYPELGKDELRGRWESVFTNRDALHAAISEDDGRMWRGFREVALNPIRNAADFRELGNFADQEIDKSVHQSQAIELPDGKVLLAAGQNVASRRIYVVDPEWLYATNRVEDFRHGLGNLTTHLFVKSLSGGWRGWAGHCAWNRAPGALLVKDPFEVSAREVLQLCRIPDPRLVSDRQGVVWNFPAFRRGEVRLTVRRAGGEAPGGVFGVVRRLFPRGEGAGFRLSLCDRWLNASDLRAREVAMFTIPVEGELLPCGAWHELVVRWNCDARTAEVLLDGRTLRRLPLLADYEFGPSYLHLQTLASGMDAAGCYFRGFAFSKVVE